MQKNLFFGTKTLTVAFNSPRPPYFISVYILYSYNTYNREGLIMKCDELCNFLSNII